MKEGILNTYYNRIWQSEGSRIWLEGISKAAFYLGLLIELTIVILDKSAYIIQYEGQWFRLTFVLFGISLITTRHSVKEWLWLLVFGIMGVVSYFATERNEILRFVVFIWACVGKDMKRVLKVTLWYTSAGCAILILLSVLGIYGTLAQTAVYRTEMAFTLGEAETRYCFGMGHPNAFHCMMLAITWLGAYCYREKIKWYGYLLLGIAHIILYFFTGSRTGLLMAVCSLLLIVLLKYVRPLQKNKWVYMAGIAAVISAVLFSVFMAKYSVHHPLLAKLDGFVSQRILNLYYDTINHEGMLSTWSLWSTPGNRYFFDLGIVRVFYWFGIIPGAVWFLAQCRLLWCGYKKKDYMLLAIVISITMYSVFEAHYVSDYLGRNYIFFFMGMYLKEMSGVDQRKEIGDFNENSAIDQRNYSCL